MINLKQTHLRRMAAAIVGIVFFLVAFPAGAQQEKIIEKLNFFETEMSIALITVADICDWDIEVAPGVKGTVSLSRSNILCQDALKALLDYGNLKMRMKGSAISIEPGASNAAAERMIIDMYEPRYQEAKNLRSAIQRFASPGGRIDLFQQSGQNLGTLIIEDFPENLTRMLNFLEILDTRPKQVAIGIKMLDVAISDTDNMGVDWTIGSGFTGSPIEFDSVLAPGGRIKFGTLSLSEFQATLEYLKANTDSQILQDQTITTKSGEPASIMVGESIPVGLQNVNLTGQGAGTAVGTGSIQEYRIGADLTVTPRVTADDEIDLEAKIKVSSFKAYQPIGGGSAAPITGNREAETQLLLENDHTLVIGGLIQENETVDKNKFPILGDLPVFGNMFRSKKRSEGKSDLLIFVTAHVLEPEDIKPAKRTPGLLDSER